MGAKLGLTFSVPYVHTIRSKARHPVKSTETKPKRRIVTSKTAGASEATASQATATADPPSKQEFVAGFLLDTPVKAIIEAANKQGVSLSSSYVYNLRRGGSPKAEPLPRGKPGRKKTNPPPTVSDQVVSTAPNPKVASPLGVLSQIERNFLSAVVLLGVARAQELLAELPKRVADSFER
jgi:hypothetical protein